MVAVYGTVGEWVGRGKGGERGEEHDSKVVYYFYNKETICSQNFSLETGERYFLHRQAK